MWLGGFNDANTDAQFKCKWVDCPAPYVTETAVDFDRSAALLGPFGTGNPYQTNVQKGKCAIDSEFFSNEEVRTLAKCALDSYDRHIQGSFFWTAHNELEPKWDYIKAWDMGWLNQTSTVKEQPKEIEFLQ